MTIGNQPIIDSGTPYKGPYTKIPLALLRQLVKGPKPLPVTVGGSNNVTFTLNASKGDPVALWNGDGFIHLKWAVTYTWGASNPILDANAAAATQSNSVLGVWYMYLSGDGTTLRPSQTAPAYVEKGEYTNGYLGHPGLSAADKWLYVGFMVCTTAATPAFLTMVKIGYEWHWASLAASPVTAALTATSVFSARVPKLAKFGGRVAGNLVTGKAGTVTVGSSSVASQGVAIAKHSGTASGVLTAPFDIPGPNDALGELYAIAVVSSGASISVTRYRDVV